jgi:hypothetical protein
MGQPAQQQGVSGIQSKMTPIPDCGKERYRGSGKLTNKIAVITGGDSESGARWPSRTREGADVLFLSQRGLDAARPASGPVCRLVKRCTGRSIAGHHQNSYR